MDSLNLKSVLIGSVIAAMSQVAEANYDWRARLEKFQDKLSDKDDYKPIVDKYASLEESTLKAPSTKQESGTIFASSCRREI